MLSFAPCSSGHWRIEMRKINATVLLGMIFTVTCLAEAENIPVVGGKESCPVVAIWRDDHGNAPTKDFGPFVITAIWQDGTVIWSKDNVRGGPPYFRGNIDPDGLESVLQGLAADEAFVVPYAYQNNFGPDSFFTAVYLFHKGLAFFSRSWHEMAEQNSKVVAASGGMLSLTALDGKSREEFLKDDKEDYLKYRQMWERIRRAITSLLPEKGEETFVEFEMKDVESEVAVEVDNPRR